MLEATLWKNSFFFNFADGLREKEKKELFPIVKQVSVMKDNTYILQRHIWNDVSEDWPFYSEEERQAFRRRKPQNLTPPGSDGSTGSAASGHSSSSSHPASPQPSLKRSASSASFMGSDNESEASHLAKKKRVSNYLRPGVSPASNSGLSPLSMGRSPSKSPQVNNQGDTFMMTMATESGESKTNAWLKTNCNEAASAASNRNSSTMIPSSSNKTNISQDFKTKFVKISSSEQRRLYKAEFNKDYNRYMVLHGQLDRVSQRFAKLQRKLKQIPETSPEHQVNKNLRQIPLANLLIKKRSQLRWILFRQRKILEKKNFAAIFVATQCLSSFKEIWLGRLGKTEGNFNSNYVLLRSCCYYHTRSSSSDFNYLFPFNPNFFSRKIFWKLLQATPMIN